MGRVQFTTKDGQIVEFHAKAKRKVSDSKLSPWQRLVRKVSSAHPELAGPALLKKASKIYHKKSGDKKSSSKRSAKKRSHKKRSNRK